MRRTELERKLRALGWTPTSEPSGANHMIWRRGRSHIAVGNYDLLWESTAENLLLVAQRKER